MGELDLTGLLTVAEAIRIIDAAPVQPRIVELDLEAAQGLCLAEEVTTDRDYPPFSKSLMDGFAVRVGDLEQLPAELRVVGEIAAGREAAEPLRAGQAMAIMTGAPLPTGADGVVPVEEAEYREPEPGAGQATIRVAKVGAWGRWIAKRGSDVKAGQVVLHKGMRLGAAQLGLAAMVGASRVRVFAAPRVAVLATGDEIVPFDRKPGKTQMRNSNSLMLMALLRRRGYVATDLGWVPDQERLIREALGRGMQFDALVVTGGMSMGRHDYVPRLLEELGVQMKITKVRIKPGKPFVFGISPGGCFVFGLPGNPVSGFVCTIRLVSRLLTRLGGGGVEERWVQGKLLSPLAANDAREFYQPVVLEYGTQEIGVRPLGWKGSADLATLAQANGLMVRREYEPALPAGARVRVLIAGC